MVLKEMKKMNLIQVNKYSHEVRFNIRLLSSAELSLFFFFLKQCV